MSEYTYKNSGVDIDKADMIVGEIKKEVGENIGMFGGIFELKYILKEYKNPVLVSSTDGVGSKLELLSQYNKFESAAVDLVAMNLNDIVCLGAKPLFFMDYIGVDSLNVNKITGFIKNLNAVLNKYDCKLVGGELAELPLIFKKDKVDVAGFVVGVAEKEELLSKNNVKKGDILIAIKSTGPHSNGYSLINKLLNDKKLKFSEKLIEPTKIIVNQTLKIKHLIKAASHITGGGIPENLNRIIPEGLKAKVKYSVEMPEVFKSIMDCKVALKEMFKTFNMGYAAIYIVDKNNVDRVLNILKEMGEEPFVTGKIVSFDEKSEFTLKSSDNRVELVI